MTRAYLERFDINLVEGKGNPGNIPTDKYYNIRKTVGLPVRMCHHIIQQVRLWFLIVTSVR